MSACFVIATVMASCIKTKCENEARHNRVERRAMCSTLSLMKCDNDLSEWVFDFLSLFRCFIFASFGFISDCTNKSAFVSNNKIFSEMIFKWINGDKCGHQILCACLFRFLFCRMKMNVNCLLSSCIFTCHECVIGWCAHMCVTWTGACMCVRAFLLYQVHVEMRSWV